MNCEHLRHHARDTVNYYLNNFESLKEFELILHERHHSRDTVNFWLKHFIKTPEELESILYDGDIE